MRRKLYVPVVLLIYLSLICAYVGMWSRIVSGEIPVEELTPILSSSSSGEQVIQTQAEVKAEVWSALYWYILPSYWGEIGYLMGYHATFFGLTTTALIIALSTVLYKEWRIPHA